MKHTGDCRFCGCSGGDEEHRTCTTPTGEPCHWYDSGRTVCSNPACVRAFGNERAKLKAERAMQNRKRTPGEIHAMKQAEARERRRRYRQKKAG